MAACAACGRANPDDARFCNACGASLAAVESPREVRKTVTVLFSDVTSSTALGERHDPESLRRVMGRWFELARETLERHGGTVEKFVGDAVMAVFGIPQVHEDDALRAVHAAVDLRTGLAALNDELQRDFGIRLETRTGVNTGRVVAGEGETLATGDAVNVAARLEQAAEPGETLLGEQTLRLVRDAVEVEAVAPLVLKGKDQPVIGYRLLAVRAGAAGVERRLDAPLVGRDAELAQLRQAFDRCVRERAAVLFTLLGPAGIGKSRLAWELLEGLRERATVLRSRCLAYGDGITYLPLAEMLRESLADDVRERAAVLVDGHPEAELIADRLAATVTAGAGAEEIAWAARKLFEHLAQAQPVVVVLDDLHWAGPTFLDLIDHVADLSRDAPILLLCLARPELLELRPGWGGGKLNAVTLLLEPLSDQEASELIEGLLAGSDLAAEARARIAEAAEGNPLFVEQMLALVAEDGAAGDLGVPPTIQALLAARLDRLGREERAVVERASVEGKVFHQGAVAELVPEPLRSDVPQRLVALVRKDLIRPDRSSFPGDEAYRFRHLLIRDAAYDALPKQERAELHERFADWLEAAAGERAGEYEEILGYHLEQAYRYRVDLGPAGPPEEELARRAATLLVSSGRAALTRRDVQAAARLLTRANTLMTPDDPERLEVLVDLADALFDAGEVPRSIFLVDEAVERAESAGLERTAARARLVRLGLATLAGTASVADGLAEAEAIVHQAERHGDESMLWRALGIVARMRFFLGRAGEADRIFTRAAGLAARHGDAPQSGLLGFHLGAKLYGPTPVPEVIEACEELLRGRPDGRRASFALAALAHCQAAQGRFHAARANATLSRQTAEEFGQRVRRASQEMALSQVEVYAGDLETAAENLRAGYEVLTELGEVGFRSSVAATLAGICAELGRVEEAEALVEDVVTTADEDDFDPRARALATSALLRSRRGEHAHAEQAAREAVALVESTDYVGVRAEVFSALAHVLAAASRMGEAVAEAERALGELELKQDLVGAAKARARLEELRAAAEVTPGDTGTIVAT
jgi:class 3 adenylate cyclase/tetratricopeptide (TPR) repeat protein